MIATGDGGLFGIREVIRVCLRNKSRYFSEFCEADPILVCETRMGKTEVTRVAEKTFFAKYFKEIRRNHVTIHEPSAFRTRYCPSLPLNCIYRI